MMSFRTGLRRRAVTLVAAALALAVVPAVALSAGKPAKGRMTGGGSVFTESGVRVTHGFQLRCRASDPRQNLQINWDSGNRFHLTQLQSASCINDPNISPRPPAAPIDTYRGVGTGRYNGVSGATARWTFTDAGEPGTADRAKIEIRDRNGNLVLVVDGLLNRGNHQAHRN